ncbi:protein kinase domain protein [Ichthyophthirius multifiliis]|uniref:Protein kinase domain protein n=1 Tax=Ichthyophthirius multifiliis TaxID=5932 RepID=G0QJJ9_ICHMU|nr:protein kinase domain protein [Ichthyophthirius multifiliis]EGR34600.1 protein kinase domain protein [Ichthyophthirius multifiliis]|eukprot:XP_004039904.1 protein kinase domain protein [Ichthyophthirius multifiliis]
MNQYGNPQYWEDRYQRYFKFFQIWHKIKKKSREADPFDWYQRFKGLKNLIQQYITSESVILNVGAGSSSKKEQQFQYIINIQKKELSEELYDEGYLNITNIDISQTVIKNMQEKYSDRGETFKYICMDVKQMEFQQNSFDFVIDKGTLDCILCGESSTINSSKVLSEIYRVLNNKGVYFLISYGLPENRKNILQKPEFQWHVTEYQIPKPTKAITEDSSDKFHYVYICQKDITEEEQQIDEEK